MKKISDRQRQRLKEYATARGRFMQDNPNCQVCNEKATDCHHSRGRAGPLISDARFFKALCRTHHDLCRDNPNAARELGILCERGKWGSTK
jgi:hypothetical protein